VSLTAAEVYAEAVRRHGADGVAAEQLSEVYEGLQQMAARKRTGVFYTPAAVAEAMGRISLGQGLGMVGAEPEQVLRLKVIDPACGCGIILAHAARFLAAQYAGRLAGGQPDPSLVFGVLPTVVLRCIFGIELDPVAAELTRLALSIETGGVLRPETLARHVICGNTLEGVEPPALGDELGAPPAMVTATTRRE